jgi:hypothetical protein
MPIIADFASSLRINSDAGESCFNSPLRLDFKVEADFDLVLIDEGEERMGETQFNIRTARADGQCSLSCNTINPG